MKQPKCSLSGERVAGVSEPGEDSRSYSWVTAEGVKQENIRGYLCDVGIRGGCEACEVQCAFGRRYLGTYKAYNKAEKPEVVKRIVQCYKGEEVIGEWDTIKEACEKLGYKSRCNVDKAVSLGRSYRGLSWRWVEQSQLERGEA